MNLLWCCIAALMTSAFAAVDVEKTVKQVQTILQSNAQLPRLTRDEIIELLNHIRAEDSKSSSTEHFTEVKQELTTKPYNVNENEISSKPIDDNIVADKNIHPVYIVTAPTKKPVETSTKKEPNVMVVLPYTPRDGSSLQELYTRPPRVEVVPQSKVTTKPFNSNEKLKETLHSNAKLANQNKQDFPAELQAFLDSHGLTGKPGHDSFLLPLDGFKPLPPAKIVDGAVQLPENILLSYDLITPSDLKKASDNQPQPSDPNSFLYEPLRPQFPFELDTSSSEQDKSVLPLTMPVRITKSTNKPNYTPIDYDAIKVIPLNQGPSPVEDERAVIETDQSKRQTNGTESTTSTGTNEETTTTAGAVDDRNALTNPPSENDSAAADSNSDSGASISDLEDSFGGAAPSQPGDSELPPPKKNGFYWMLDWNSFLEVGSDDDETRRKVNIRFEPKLGDPQMFVPVSVP